MKTLSTCAVLLMMSGPVLAQQPAPIDPATVPPPGPSIPPPTTGGHVPAAATLESVKRALRETDLPSNDIIVSTHADALVLTGHVASKADSARAESTAQTAAGGVKVINEIAVQAEDQSEALPAAGQSGTDQPSEVEAH